MKTYSKRSFILGFITAIVLSAAIVPVFGALTQKTVTLLEGVTIYIEDERLDNAGAFIYEGRTYLPVRAVSEALGKYVGWNESTNTVYISDSEVNIPEPAPQPSAAAQSIVGKWKMDEFELMGDRLTVQEIYQLTGITFSFEFDFRSDGTAIMTFDGESESCTYTVNGTTVTLFDGYDTISMTLKDGKLFFYDDEGLTFYLKKQ